MSQSASAIFDIIAPNYASDPDKAEFISLARGRVRSSWYVDRYEYAVALMAAHLITLTKTRAEGGAGSITSKREGDLAVSYASVAGTGSGDLSLTHYGEQLKGLRSEAGMFVGVTGGRDDGSNS